MRRTDGSDGGPAFPELRPFNADWAADPGMSLRDYFAAKALEGILAFPGTLDGDHNKSPSTVARAAYNYADAMIEARSK